MIDLVNAETVQDGLLIVSLTLAVALVLISTGTLGRKVADLEYQIAAGLNGVRRIQAWLNIRGHADRIMLGGSFIVINALLLADAPVVWRTWINRTLFVFLMAVYAATAVRDWIDERKQVRMLLTEQIAAQAAKALRAADDEIRRTADLLAERNSYRDMATEAIQKLEIAVNQERETAGDAPFVPLAPVVPEHSSPVTPLQAETAAIATLRSRLVAATLALGLEPPEPNES